MPKPHSSQADRKCSGIVLAILMIGCSAAAPRRPSIVVRIDRAEWSSADLGYVRRAARAWQALGLAGEVAFDVPAGPVCPRSWYATASPRCSIVVTVSRVPGFALQYGPDGVTDRSTRAVIVDARRIGWELAALLAHEIGHAALDVGHLAPGAVGVMQPDSGLWIPTQADFSLACETRGICR